ncbi:DUF1634 domain-containing protein [Candidatus Bathyarchaeota archaeon]|nr:MAG: DUF1634 domain-containing protein [Candidatus Bathyarchaeota archaeon]
MELNRLVSYSLRIGVLASVLLSLVGLFVWAAGGFDNIVSAAGPGIARALASAFQGNDSGLIYLAIVILIATPVFRVAISSVYFVKKRDGKYVLISLAVLSMLVFALVSGYAG